MTFSNHTKEYDFELQALGAQEAENKFREILDESKIELKTERNIWHRSGNMCIEYESYGQPSGIAVTTADYWTHELRTKGEETLTYLTFPTPILRKFCNELMDEDIFNQCEWREGVGGRYWRVGGEGKNMEMLLVRLSDLFNYLKKTHGEGDDIFLTRKQRMEQGHRLVRGD